MGIGAQYLHGARVCIIPSPYNDHRPYALRHKPLAFLSGLLIAAKVVALTLVAIVPNTAELSTITAARIVEFTNAERVNVGLSALSVNSKLSSAAAQKGQHMLDEDYFAHISPSGVTPWFWMSKVGYTYTIAGENLAIDFVEAEDVVDAWLASPTHKANMLHKDYTETGVAVVTGEFEGGTSTIVVHMFGNPVGQKSVSGTTATPTPTPAPSQAPAPTPTATPVPTPTATPVPPPSDVTPPRTPRIAFVNQTVSVGESAEVSVEGEPSSTVYLLVNSQTRADVVLDENGEATVSVPLTSFPDGSLVLRAYSTDSENNQSELSEALAFVKDTAGPSVEAQQLAFAVSPGFDRMQAALRVTGDDLAELELVGASRHPVTSGVSWIPFEIQTGPIEVKLLDTGGNETSIDHLSLLPEFFEEAPGADFQEAPARFNQLARRLSIAIVLSLAVLLVLAIAVRVRIQQPGLITHASFVILLAAVLFLI